MLGIFSGWGALLAVGMPVAFTLYVVSIAYLLMNTGIALSPQKIISGLNSFPLLAVPFFIFSGLLMNSAGITDKMFNFARNLTGHFTGSLGHVNILASLLFSGMSGSAHADAGGLGQLEIKAMRDEGYDDGFSGAITAASSVIGPLMPPSIPMVIYGVMSGASVGALFLAGIVPALLCTVALMVMVYIIAKKKNYKVYPRASMKMIFSSFKEAFLALLTPVIIIGGIFSGIVTPTEAAVVASLYAMFLGFFVYKELTFSTLVRLIHETVNTSAVIGFLIGGVSLFGYLIIKEDIPMKAAELFLQVTDSPIVFLLMVSVMLFILGAFIETLALLLILVPILLPITVQLGIDPVHFGVVVVLNMMLGILTPPMGVSLFVVSKVGNIPYEVLARSVIVFLIPLIAVLLLIIFFPQLVLFLPNMLL
ncbi:TRAP transporter large permease [Photobacterium profundum]|uniref:TRAP transporter large permease protein n=1 Tax=Photobacterium profundum 3TCK TaxID=314280 RepID=Q1Z3U5_9GAMM|nr:TRAP transporter large permease [Photobacterium profundum]EAS43133.1 putative TRAP-type C4-dicarboxylate transport system, large permease component [Photobacterium profundum 3TCK]PSV62342.1 TRAP transporter large permease [Photobacterium profundum]